ncbi:MAG: MBL fold metallo-hydrolase [Clostridia bacterium]|nr:MBL fold metallo-hydrolase [Clostridia bacterium]
MKVTPYFECGLLGENTYVITDETSGLSAVIDPDLVYVKPEAVASACNIKYILLTHNHFDHIYSADKLRSLTGAEILITAIDAPGLEDSNSNLASMMDAEISLKADRKLSDGEIIMLGDTEIRVMLTPGHTPGSCCYITDDVIFSGDTLFESSIGRTDFPGGSMADMNKSLRKLISLEGDYDIYPGHGAATKLSTEKKYNPYLGGSFV